MTLTRKVALACVLCAQTVFFFAFLDRPIRPIADNVRYETAGYNLSRGRGIALPFALAPDPRVHGWVCDRHPGACAKDTIYPTAIYAPGYSLFLAAIYIVAGHSLSAVVGVQLVMLWILFVIFEALSAHLLNRVGYLFAIGVATCYPFLARQAGMIMSDHLHATLVLAAFGALLLMKPGLRRGVVAGVFLAGAALARPHMVLVIPALLLVPSVRRGLQGSWREWIVIASVCALPFGAWTARNAYWFGHFVPLTTYKMGTLVLWTTWEWEPPNTEFGDRPHWDATVERRFGGDACSIDVSEKALADAKLRISAAPLKFLERIAVHIPRYWISVGDTAARPRGWQLIVAYLAALFVLGVCGLWIKRRDERWHPLLVLVVVYTGFLLPFTFEARRTLPLRLPLLLFAAAAVSHFASRRSEK